MNLRINRRGIGKIDENHNVQEFHFFLRFGSVHWSLARVMQAGSEALCSSKCGKCAY